jgi:hypothetical protein
MKKVLFPFILLLFSLVSLAQTGKVKVYFAGFICERETWDDALQLDGKGDEVFLNFLFSMADGSGKTKFESEKRTKTYGDATGDFSDRINVGSCVDLFGGAKGGIKAGDKYYCNDLIGEYDLSAGDVLSLIPIISEWDPGQDIHLSVLSDIKGATSEMNQQIVRLVNSAGGNFGSAIKSSSDLEKFVISGNILNLPSPVNVVQSLQGKQFTRPIGMFMNGSFVPKVIILDKTVLETVSKSNFFYGQGVIPIHYNEEALGNTRDHGNYKILIKVEYTPPPATVTAVAPVSSQTIIQSTKEVTKFLEIDMVAPTGTSTTTTTTTSSQPASETTNTSGGSKSSTSKGKSSGKPVR